MIKKNKNKDLKIFNRKEKKKIRYIRYMIPFDVKCLSCFKITKKGIKVNAFKEKIFTEKYFDIFLFRF